MKRPAWRSASALLALVLGGCVVSSGLRVDPVAPQAKALVSSPVKAHLMDGSTVVFPKGVSVEGGFVSGEGTRYDVSLKPAGAVTRLPLADVAAMESYRLETDGVASGTLSVLAAAGSVAAGVALFKAIFGSCPTVYSRDGAGAEARLEAETFSYSIAPLLESRDLDRLHADVDADGRLRLEVRNEALETHYINHMQVLEVRHRAGEAVMPDHRGRPQVVGPRAAAVRATTRAGSDVTDVLARTDGDAFRTDRVTLDAAGPGNLEDFLDLTFAAPAGGGEWALVLTARSSLLNTVLFYDVMLAAAGPHALDWLGRDLDQIANAVELGRFVQRHMGLKVAVATPDGFREVARVPDPGPIAFHDVAVPLPATPDGGDVRVRLTFVADAWRIDSIGLADLPKGGAPRTLRVAAVTGSTGQAEPDALRSLLAPDHDHLKTSPGQRFFARFDPEPLAPGERRTFLLSSQGYYTEWVRGAWLRAPRASRAFVPSDDAIVEALARWRREQPSLEARFETQRVPVF